MPTKPLTKRKRTLSTKRNSRPSAAKPTRARNTAKLPKKPPRTKTDLILGMLGREDGASIDEMAAATGWQSHSVRGFLSGTVKKKLKVKIVGEKVKGESRRYHVRAS